MIMNDTQLNALEECFTEYSEVVYLPTCVKGCVPLTSCATPLNCILIAYQLTSKDVFTTVKYMIIMMIPRTIELLIIVNCWTYALGRKKKIIVFATEDKLSLI